MKRRIAFAMLLGMGTFFLVSCGRPTPEKVSGWVTKKIEKELKVTDAQKAGLETLRRDAVAHWSAMAEQRRLVSLEIEKQLRAEKADPDAVKKLMAATAKIEQEGQLAMVDKTSAWVATLSAEQRTKLADMHKKMSHRALPRH